MRNLIVAFSCLLPVCSLFAAELTVANNDKFTLDDKHHFNAALAAYAQASGWAQREYAKDEKSLYAFNPNAGLAGIFNIMVVIGGFDGVYNDKEAIKEAEELKRYEEENEAYNKAWQNFRHVSKIYPGQPQQKEALAKLALVIYKVQSSILQKQFNCPIELPSDPLEWLINDIEANALLLKKNQNLKPKNAVAIRAASLDQLRQWHDWQELWPCESEKIPFGLFQCLASRTKKK